MVAAYRLCPSESTAEVMSMSERMIHGVQQPSLGAAAAVIGVIAVVLLAWSFIGSRGATGPASFVAPELAAAQRATASSPPAITLAQYNGLKMGASLADVEAALGAPTERMAETQVGGIRSVAVSWQNADGSNAMLVFNSAAQGQQLDVNMVLATKAQFGLR